MITANRWQHILGVARKAKVLAEKLKPNDTKYAEDNIKKGLRCKQFFYLRIMMILRFLLIH